MEMLVTLAQGAGENSQGMFWVTMVVGTALTVLGGLAAKYVIPYARRIRKITAAGREIGSALEETGSMVETLIADLEDGTISEDEKNEILVRLGRVVTQWRQAGSAVRQIFQDETL